MLYSEFINKAFDEVIVEADNGLYYLEPTWTVILLENQLDPKIVSDYETDWAALNDVFKLEVEKRNTIASNEPRVIDWIYNIISTQIEPEMMVEETDYLKQVIEFMKTNHEQQKLSDEEWNKFRNV